MPIKLQDCSHRADTDTIFSQEGKFLTLPTLPLIGLPWYSYAKPKPKKPNQQKAVSTFQ